MWMVVINLGSGSQNRQRLAQAVWPAFFFWGQTWKFLAGKIMGNCHTWRFLAGKKYGNKWRLPKGSPTKRWTPYRKKSNLPG